MILIYERGWYLTYHYWPTSENTHVWEMSYYFPPSRTASERIPLGDQEITVRHFHKVVGDWVDAYRRERAQGRR